MSKKNRLSVYWNDELVGYIDDVKMDNFHLYGFWYPAETSNTQRFLGALQQHFANEEDYFYVRLGDQNPLIGSVEDFREMQLPAGQSKEEIEILIRPSGVE
jgi:hypothetical protein